MSEDWVAARTAWEMVWPGKKPMGGPNAIITRAASGVVRAKASSLRKGDAAPERDCLIPDLFWKGRGMIPNWEQGDFSADVQHNGTIGSWKAFGVVFEQAGIAAMVPDGQAIAPTEHQVIATRSKGGAPGKYDWAKAVGSVIFDWSNAGTWHPTSQGEVKARLADWFAAQGQTPDDRQLKHYAGWLLEQFRKHGAKCGFRGDRAQHSEMMAPAIPI